MRESVKPEATDVPSLAPLPRQGVRGCRDGKMRVEGGIEATDLRNIGHQPPDGLHRTERRLMERREIDQALEPRHDLVVDQDRFNELAAAVDDSVTDGVDPPGAVKGGSKRAIVDAAAAGGQDDREPQLGAIVKKGQFQAAGARIDDEDQHAAPEPWGHVHSRTSGASSPSARV